MEIQKQNVTILQVTSAIISIIIIVTTAAMYLQSMPVPLELNSILMLTIGYNFGVITIPSKPNS